MTAARGRAAGGGVNTLRLAAGEHRLAGRITPEIAGLITEFLAGHPEVSWEGQGDFGVWHASVEEPDGTAHLQEYTPAALLGKLAGRLGPPG